MITVGELGKTRRFRDQHAHHFAAAVDPRDVLIHEVELGAQQVGGRTLVALDMPCTVSNVALVISRTIEMKRCSLFSK